MRLLAVVFAACSAPATIAPVNAPAQLDAEPPTALSPPRGAPCYAVEWIVDGRSYDHLRVWTDAAGRALYMDQDRAPRRAHAWTYDGRGLLVKHAWLSADGRGADAYRYGAHGELLEIVNRSIDTDGGRPFHHEVTYTWRGDFRADAVAPAPVRAIPRLAHADEPVRPEVPGSDAYDPPAFTGTVTSTEQETWTFERDTIRYRAPDGRADITRKMLEGRVIVTTKVPGRLRTHAYEGGRLVVAVITDEGAPELREVSTYDDRGRWTGTTGVGLGTRTYVVTPSCR